MSQPYAVDGSCSASRHVRQSGLLGQVLESVLQRGSVVQGAVEADAVVEADVVLQEALPLIQGARGDAVPELLLDGALYALHLAVEVGAPRPDAGVTDA